jgi:hypothetical protein
MDQHEHYDTKQDAKCNGTHKMSAHDNDYVDDNDNMTPINRHIAASKSLFDSTVAASALIVTTFGIYELSIINISTVATASPSPTQPHQPEMGIQLWHVRFNLLDCVLMTALVVATTPTVVSLFLGRYVRLICREWWIEHLLLAAQEDSVKPKESRRRTAARNLTKTMNLMMIKRSPQMMITLMMTRTILMANQTRTPRRSATHGAIRRQLRQKMMMTETSQSRSLWRHRLFVAVAKP